MSALAKMLRKARKAAGLTQVDASKRLGVSQTTISSWEVGALFPRPGRLAQIGAIYQVDKQALTSAWFDGKRALVGAGQ